LTIADSVLCLYQEQDVKSSQRKEAITMKKTITILASLAFVLAFALVYANEGWTMSDDMSAKLVGDHDSLIDTLDPSNVPGNIDAESGVVREAVVFTAMTKDWEFTDKDGFLAYIDPSNVPGNIDAETGVVKDAIAFNERGAGALGKAAGGMREPETLLDYIAPPSIPQ
jgi:hypothetical protein